MEALEHGSFEATGWLEFSSENFNAADATLSNRATERYGEFCIDTKLKQGFRFGFGRLISRQDTNAWHQADQPNATLLAGERTRIGSVSQGENTSKLLYLLAISPGRWLAFLQLSEVLRATACGKQFALHPRRA